MGGRAGRTLFATISMLGLALSSIGVGTNTAADACVGSGTAAPAPPDASYAGSPVVAIHVQWADADAALLQYIVTDSVEPLKDPFGGTDAAWTSGCREDAIICEKDAPLVLTSTGLSGRNRAAPTAGHFTIVAASGGACAYYGGDGKPYYASAGGELAVTATIEDRPDGVGPPSLSRKLGPVMVPTFEMPPMDLRPQRRVVGSFDWDPATGVTNVRAATAGPTGSIARLPGVPWWVPPIIAGAPVGYDAMEGLSEGLHEGQPGGSAGAEGSDGAADAEGASTPEVDADFDADFEERMLRPVEGQPPPADPPPEGELGPGRRWVSVGAQHVLAKEEGKKRRGLKPGVWYQVREKKDGSLVFFDAKGTKLGSTSQARRAVLQLQEQGASTERSR